MIKNQNETKEIRSIEDKVEFQRIVGVLNRYYEARSERFSSESMEFRKKFASSKHEEVRILVKKFGEFEYMVTAYVKDETDTWIHVDGIAMERKELSSEGNSDHPVFLIVGLGDLFDKAELS